jgi:hypothetical protein
MINLPEQQQNPSVRQQIKDLSERAKDLLKRLELQIGPCRTKETNDEYRKRIELAYVACGDSFINIQDDIKKLRELTKRRDEIAQLQTLQNTIQKPIANALTAEAYALVDRLDDSINRNTVSTPIAIWEETKKAIHTALTASGTSESALIKLKKKNTFIENPHTEAKIIIKDIRSKIVYAQHYIDKRALDSNLYANDAKEAWAEGMNRANELKATHDMSKFIKKLERLGKSIEELTKDAAFVVAANSPTGEIPTIKKTKTKQSSEISTNTGKSKTTGLRRIISGWFGENQKTLVDDNSPDMLLKEDTAEKTLE